ncbi:MAG: serine/threonine protein kinase, partial [Planctomycetes bacterium]|nr:serine/threonine protein kinase [Planctomycetota bacterium]
MKRLVALKVISPRFTEKPEAVDRFQRELKAAARLSHPNIATAYDAEQAGNTHFLVMEFVEGTTLARLVAESGTLPVARACDYVRQAASGLQHAFERGMVHRDIKPQNLILTPEGQIKILDFGLALFVSQTGPADALTDPGAVMGTPDYIAPEQASDAHSADVRADIYSLGCTLYYLLAGRPPYPEGTFVQKLMSHVERSAKPLTELRKDIPPALAGLIDRMRAKDPSRRYQTPAEVAEALTPFAQTAPSAARLTTSPIPSHRTAPVSSRRWLPLAAAAVLLVGFGVWFAPQVILIAQGKGRLVIEPRDASIEVTVRHDGATLIDRETKRRYELTAGEYEIEVREGPDGLRFFTKKFNITRGGNEVVNVRIEMAKATQPGTPGVASPPPIATERAAIL